MENITYKNSEEIFSKISEKLSSYTNSGILDMSLFYSDIHNLLRKLGDYFTEDKVEVLYISNYKSKLPSDFSKLSNLYLAENYQENSQQQIISSHIVPIITENSVEYVHQIERLNVEIPKHKLSKGSRLRYNGKASVFLDNDSLNYNSNSPNEFRIDNRFIYCNITDKKLILEYNAFPYDEDGYPLIPDLPKIEEAIENLLFFKVFEYLYINRYADVLNEMKYYKEEARQSFAEAMTFVKLPTQEDVFKFILYKRNISRKLL